MLPLTRNTTYTTVTPVNPVDLNAIQDSIVGNKHGTLTLCRSCFGEAVESGSVGPSGAIWRLSVAGILIARLPTIPVGKRVTAVRYRAKDGSGSAITAQLTADIDGARNFIDTKASAASGVLQTLTFVTGNYQVAANTVYYVRATCPTTTSDHWRIEVDFDQL